ncbi:16S rRNA (cytosine(1402)-N(4))-methyltransferase [Candidatus Shapirobacteria bacterium CG08_land_8_20_14_0_20_39_18]|uniref:Ribosomal RNA small subunit methyltransferase H n=1 Tax=Candidatus Shapirobacteria bacterium CG08_land_8_20_14_0_20_39_18 TaxID=1974883 RepID=A0A2M6XE59_9BACT|nr:MAG: 16S rRNA (cytosine(1402)-N(4))-methyltransferase [Candidatus Shapirobacteria bacterium CG08_land_8_20_14_0_20_39_18]PIY64724.1 MAG: 16S rRNA (cytosine(1402)-N(4))-methyltransferase [Candidatus Shapirobacteria bacterium CG_4_10_14_0_8_um_filter_39_15]PJE68676.1 MAG: 16S rRNA (cytosine(1402)-N(4))-methyltransferase [Candidatus Shapirobacteria bacterium CG10_big_fil_rev_8_21_14_0_10_38_8]
MSESAYHTPVLLKEVTFYLDLDSHDNGIYVDCTLGGGGHSEAILEKIGPAGKLIGIDQDIEAIEAAKKRLDKYGDRVTIVHDNFISLGKILLKTNISRVDGILIDLGISFHQLETPSRGFSFNQQSLDSKLDMRMNQNQDLNAYDVVNLYPEKELRRIFFELGEETYGGKIAAEIIRSRQKKKIETTGELIDVIRRATPPDYRFSKEHGSWASKVFRAIRMEVNQELPVLQEILPQALECLKPAGRLAVISFHSLEDRIVKKQFVAWQKSGLVEILTPAPIEASPEELAFNSRSASAKLRVIKKL